MTSTVQDLVRHVCHEPTGCTCCTGALEPDDNCPKHGCGPWPPRCEECGRFLPWSVRNIEVSNSVLDRSCPPNTETERTVKDEVCSENGRN